MQADDAMRILGSAAAMGLLGGGGALAYNATTKPILDEYGNVIESNDINPIMAALGSAAIGAVGSGIYGKMNQPVAKPVQGVSAGTSPQPRQSPDIVEPEVTPTQKMPRQDAEYPYETYWEQSRPDERTPGDNWDDIANAVDEVTDPEKVAQRNAQYEAEFAKKQQAAYQESKQKQALQQERIKRQQAAIDFMKAQGYNPEYGEYRGLVRNEFGELVKPKKPFNNANYGVEGWDYLETNLVQPTVQVVPASPMQMQNPMTPPGMRTVVIQPMKEPGQEMIEEALRLKELARRQSNPSVPYDVFGESDGYWEAQKKTVDEPKYYRTKEFPLTGYPETFRTEGGNSLYYLQNNSYGQAGMATKRIKGERLGHGSDYGEKPTSAATYYLDSQDARKISDALYTNTENFSAYPNASNTLQIRYDSYGNPKEFQVPYSYTPSVGKQPFELLSSQGNAIVDSYHVGSGIKEISYNSNDANALLNDFRLGLLPLKRKSVADMTERTFVDGNYRNRESLNKLPQWAIDAQNRPYTPPSEPPGNRLIGGNFEGRGGQKLPAWAINNARNVESEIEAIQNEVTQQAINSRNYDSRFSNDVEKYDDILTIRDSDIPFNNYQDDIHQLMTGYYHKY